MFRALQILAVALLIAVLVGARYGFSALFDWTGPGFTTGFLAGMVFVCGWVLILKLFGLKLD